MGKSWTGRWGWGSTAGMVVLFQAGGCALDPASLFVLFADTFLTLVVNSFVSQIFGVGFGI